MDIELLDCFFVIIYFDSNLLGLTKIGCVAELIFVGCLTQDAYCVGVQRFLLLFLFRLFVQVFSLQFSISS
jgi:hypothetical protein